MPTDFEKKIQAKLAAQEKLGQEIAELKAESAKAKKAQREKDVGRIGRLAVQAGLDQFNNQTLNAAFEKLAENLAAGPHFLASPSIETESDDKQREGMENQQLTNVL